MMIASWKEREEEGKEFMMKLYKLCGWTHQAAKAMIDWGCLPPRNLRTPTPPATYMPEVQEEVAQFERGMGLHLDDV